MHSHSVFCTPKALILAAPTPVGHVAVAVVGQRVAGVSMAHPNTAAAVRRLARILDEGVDPAPRRAYDDPRMPLATDVLDRLVRYLAGEPVALDDVPVDCDHLSAFQRRVAAACRAIPFGMTRSYGEVAAAAGSPGAARAVGQVMAANRTPLIVPCHRVLAAGGKIGGFSAPQGLALKRRLLALESGDGAPGSQGSPRARRRAQPRLFV